MNSLAAFGCGAFSTMLIGCSATIARLETHLINRCALSLHQVRTIPVRDDLQVVFTGRRAVA